MDAIPKIDPCEKSRPPIVIIKKTPVAAIIVTYTWESTSDRFPTILKFVSTLNRRKITTSPTTGRSERINDILDNFLSCCSFCSVFVFA